MGNVGTNVKLNFLKGIACIGVVFIHVTFPGKFGQIILNLAAYAVPIFFMIAGYYAYGKDAVVIKRRLIKIIKIFLYAYLLFFIDKLVNYAYHHQVLQWLSKVFTWKTPMKTIIFCTVDFAIPLWYLIAMIETYIAWFFIVKKGKELSAIKFISVLFLLQIILTGFCETMNLAWSRKINFLTRALPWFMLGYSLNLEKTQRVRSAKTSTLVALVIIGCVIVVIPTAFDLPIKFTVIGYIPYALGLFCLSLRNPSKSICKPIEFVGDKLSLNVYILHPVLNGVIGTIFSALFHVDTHSVVFSWIRPIIAVVASILLSLAIYEIMTFVKKSRNSL